MHERPATNPRDHDREVLLQQAREEARRTYTQLLERDESDDEARVGLTRIDAWESGRFQRRLTSRVFVTSRGAPTLGQAESSLS